MLDWINITKEQEFNFTVAITYGVRKETVLWQAIKWISNHLKPEDVFSENRLIDWHQRYQELKDRDYDLSVELAIKERQKKGELDEKENQII